METTKRPSRSRVSRGQKTGGKHNSKNVSQRRSSPYSGGNRSGGSNFRSSGGHSQGGGFRRGGGGGNRGGGRKMPTFDPSRFINTNPVEEEPEVFEPKNTFHTFGLNQKLVGIVEKMGIKIPTPIQDRTIPEIMNGHDVIGLAETGTGKTAAFLLPLIEKTLKDHSRQTLIMAPTRELAVQINDEFRKLSFGFHLYSTVCVGGMDIRPQIRGLKKRNHFVIGTPGRIVDLIKRKDFNPQKITTVVLDEADRMLDMGFIHDMRTILSATPSDRETLFFSATMTSEAKNLVNDFLRNPVTISVKKKDVTNNIKQDVVRYKHSDKFETLTRLLSKDEFKRVLIFGAMKHSVNKLAKELSTKGFKAESIHGNKTHGQRQRSLAAFKNGSARVLVATDVAARGIHVDGVSHVINYDLPGTFEDYVHRIGRTGRGTKRGMALTFVPEGSRGK